MQFSVNRLKVQSAQLFGEKTDSVEAIAAHFSRGWINSSESEVRNLAAAVEPSRAVQALNEIHRNVLMNMGAFDRAKFVSMVGAAVSELYIYSPGTHVVGKLILEDALKSIRGLGLVESEVRLQLLLGAIIKSELDLEIKGTPRWHLIDSATTAFYSGINALQFREGLWSSSLLYPTVELLEVYRHSNDRIPGFRVWNNLRTLIAALTPESVAPYNPTIDEAVEWLSKPIAPTPLAMHYSATAEAMKFLNDPKGLRTEAMDALSEVQFANYEDGVPVRIADTGFVARMYFLIGDSFAQEREIESSVVFFRRVRSALRYAGLERCVLGVQTGKILRMALGSD